jgi:hypothetical protein
MSDPLENFVVTLKYTLKDINTLINNMNQPFTTPVMQWANFITDIHLQIEPQVKEINKDEPETTAEEQGN